MGWPGLWSEVKDICEEIEIKKAIFDHHLKYMKDNFHKKLEDNKYDDFSVEQPYMDEKSVEVGRTAFKIRSKMVEDIPANLKTNSEEKAETVRRDCSASTTRRKCSMTRPTVWCVPPGRGWTRPTCSTW